MSIDASMWAWKQRISPTQKLILLSMADRAGEDFTCWPSNARLCLDTGLNRKTVYACIAQLIDMGLIVRIKTDGATNIYQLVGISGRETVPLKTSAVKYTSPKIGTSAESGTSPKNGQQPVPKTDFDQSQKRDIESLRESLREPPKEEGACTRCPPALFAAPSAIGTWQEQAGQPEAEQAGQGTLASKGSTAPPTARKKQKEQKKSYGEFGNVLLTVQEYSRLEAEYGPEKALAAIDFLDLHLGARKGADPYKSHYLAMRKWVFDAVAEKRGKQSCQQAQPPWAGKSFDQMCAEDAARSTCQHGANQYSANQSGGSHETPAI